MKSKDQNAAVAAIQFALETDDGLTFLRLWNQGDFDKTRLEWPEAPEAVYIGADPLHPDTVIRGQAVDHGEALAELADVCNELCVAVDTTTINADITKLDHAQKWVLQRRADARSVLARLGY